MASYFHLQMHPCIDAVLIVPLPLPPMSGRPAILDWYSRLGVTRVVLH